MRPIIKVENLSKSYRIGARQESYGTLSERIGAMIRAPLKGFSLNGKSTGEVIWALKDVSFDVQQGETVGIIGRNGAGKSTLLKVLSRITEPTSGRALLWGRIASLLEVGTGFHPELTGRENVYLNGAILGMSHSEIQHRFDEIVAFAEIDKFIDTPVKRYSSGMYVRLAFAVAAHLEPDILVIDEVLSVGDAAFQKKCLGKIGDVANEGRTVLFVSHNMAAVSNLCRRAVLISGGRVEIDGSTTDAIDKYLMETGSFLSRVPLADRLEREGDGRIRFTDIQWETIEGERVSALRSGSDYNLVLSYACSDGVGKNNVVVSFGIKDYLTGFLLLHRTDFSNQNFNSIPSQGRFKCRIRRLPLTAGQYLVSLFVGIDEKPCDSIDNASEVTVEYGDFYGTKHPGRPNLCKVLVECNWELEQAKL